MTEPIQISGHWPGIKKVPDQDLIAMAKVAQAIRTPPDCLAGVIAFETAGTWSPSVRNRLSGAVGLIQFTSVGAKAVGKTRVELSKMSFQEQLKFVQKYYEQVRVEGFPTCDMLYMATFAPAFVARPDSAVIARKGQKAYDQNAGLDRDKDGTLTRGDVVAVFNAYARKNSPIQRGKKKGRLPQRPVETKPRPTEDKGTSLFWDVVFVIGIGFLIRRAIA